MDRVVQTICEANITLGPRGYTLITNVYCLAQLRIKINKQQLTIIIRYGS